MSPDQPCSFGQENIVSKVGCAATVTRGDSNVPANSSKNGMAIASMGMGLQPCERRGGGVKSQVLQRRSVAKRWLLAPRTGLMPFAATVLALVGFVGSGCGPKQDGARTTADDRKGPASARPYSIQECKIDVSLQPITHRLEGTATLTAAFNARARRSNGDKFRLQLHRDLGIDSIELAGKQIGFRCLPGRTNAAQSQPSTSNPATASAPDDAAKKEADRNVAVYELDWKPKPGQPGTLVIRYGGRLFQDVAAGEKPGQIHNKEMKAHVAEEGVFLSEESAWYPQLPDLENGKDNCEIELTQFELTAAEVPGMVLVASGNRVEAAINKPRGARTTWRSPFPLPGLSLVGGPHQVHQRQVGDVLVSVHLLKDHAGFAPGLLDAVESYLRLYQPLIGKYPYAEFTVVENFFSSGFAFPGFTVLASAVIAMGPMGLEPGYLDHELLHNWWGNGVFVSGLDGNWCEGLTSYCANYMRHVMDGRDKKARAIRRDACYGLSRLTSDKDKPLDGFGRDDGPGELIGYQKGAMVFAMLAEQVGQDTLWRGLRRLRTERLGRPTGWDDIRQALEQESHQALDVFFRTWVRGAGLPDITIDEAAYDSRARRLTITTSQKGPPTFELKAPVRLVYGDGFTDEMVSVNRAAQVSVIKLMDAPKYVELDPDFHLIHRVPLSDVMPSISGIGKAKPLVIVRTGDDFEAYEPAAEQLELRYQEATDTSVRYVNASELKPDDFKQGHALILGKACLAAAAQELLKGQSLVIGDGFFSVGDKRYEKPTDEVLCCVRNENDAGGVFCFYYGNNAASLKKARVATFYGGNSLVVFENGQAAYRQDFEKAEQVLVQIEGR